MKNLAKHLRLGCVVAALLLPAALWAQQEDNDQQKVNQLSLGLQILTHGERRNGGLSNEGDTDDNDDANFLMNRTRLTLSYRKDFNPADKAWGRVAVDTKIVAQNSGIWGMKGNNSFVIYEAWAKLTDKTGLFLQVGRQALAYDDERIIGPNDWAMASLSHDVVRLGYEGHGHKAHAILAYNQNAANVNGGTYYDKNNGSQPYKTMHTLWYHYDVPKIPLGASLLFMNVGMQAGIPYGVDTDRPRTEYQRLYGGYVSYCPDHWSLEGAYYRQKGKNEDGVKINAWMASILGKWSPTAKCGFHAGFDYLSGDDYMPVPKQGELGLPKHDEIKYFLPVYGSQHKFYGAMDFFYLSNFVNQFSPGLQNAFVGADIHPVKNLKIGVSYHYLAMATKLKDMDMTLGHEIEVEASYRLIKEASLSAGFSYMTGTDSMERLKRASGDGSLRWAWFSLVISPSLFTTRW